MDFYGFDELIKQALAEDIGHGDITTLSLILEEQTGEGIFYAKGEGILAGIRISQQVFACLDPQVKFESYKNDGDLLVPATKL
jgi:nicotinate-nucleotide pyrophosphorylase (carboxylating)